LTIESLTIAVLPVPSHKIVNQKIINRQFLVSLA